MKKILILILVIIITGCSQGINNCKTYSYKKKPNISTAQYFPLRPITDPFGNRVYRAWELNNKMK